MSWFRKSNTTCTVQIVGKYTVEEVMANHKRFVDLCMKYRLDIVELPGQANNELTVKGRPKRVAAFERDFMVLQMMGLV